MKCSNCGTEIKNGNVCPKCGLNQISEDENKTEVLEPVDEEEVTTETDKVEEKNGLVVPVVILIIIVICLACGVFFCKKMLNNKKDVSSNNKTTVLATDGQNVTIGDTALTSYKGYNIGLPDGVVATLTSDGFLNIEDIDKNYNLLIKIYNYKYDDAKEYLNSAKYLEAVTVAKRTILQSPEERTINGLKTYVVSYSNPDYISLIYDTIVVEFKDDIMFEFEIVYDNDKVSNDKIDSIIEKILKDTTANSSSEENLPTTFESTISEKLLNNE